MFGFSKIFVIIIFIAAAVGYGTKSWINFFIIFGAYALIKIIWKLLT